MDVVSEKLTEETPEEHGDIMGSILYEILQCSHHLSCRMGFEVIEP